MKILVLLTLLLASLAVYFAESAVFTIDPAEDAFVVRNDKIVRRYGPGLGIQIPYLESVGYIATREIRKTVVSLNGRLSDSSTCLVDANIQYSIADPLRAFEWRRRHGLDISKETSSASKRSDYSEPMRIFKIALEEMMNGLTAENAANGPIEKWIGDFSRSRNQKTNQDGTNFVNTSVENVSCSEQHVKPICKPVFEQFHPFDQNNTFRPESFSGDLLEIEFQPLKIILRNQDIVLVKGLVINAEIIDPDRLYMAARTEKRAILRTQTMLEYWLRVALGKTSAEHIKNFNFWESIESDASLKQRISSLGLRIVSIDKQNAYFSYNEAQCEN